MSQTSMGPSSLRTGSRDGAGETRRRMLPCCESACLTGRGLVSAWCPSDVVQGRCLMRELLSPDVPHGLVTHPANPAALQEVFHGVREGYGSASKAAKTRLVDDLVLRTGFHRKHVIRLLRGRTLSAQGRRFYDETVRDALVVAWEASGRVCGKRLKDVLPKLVVALVREGRLPRDLVLRGKLTRVSAATIDRLLAPVRAKRTAVSLEEQLVSMREALVEFTRFELPADITPEERRGLEAQYCSVVDQLRQFSGANR